MTISLYKDHLSFPINDELDIYGCDISKVLRLITKSNTTPSNWLQSPIVYRENEEFKASLWQLCQSYICARANIHHYRRIAHGALDTMQDDEIKIKKFFYILSPLLAAIWCAKHSKIAPMSMSPLDRSLKCRPERKNSCLIQIKSKVREGYKIKIDSEIIN